MIRKPTWILLVLLAGLIGFMFYYNNKKALSAFETTPTASATFLFGPEDGLPSRIQVESSTGETVELAHDAEQAWTLTLPIEAAADQGLAEAAASQVTTLRVLDQVDLGLEIIGLDRPTYVITIGFTGGTVHKLEVGSLTPTQSGYYVRVDGERLVIVNKTSLDSLLNLVTAPPYAETPTPSPLPPTATPDSATEATPTPTP